MNIVTTQVHDVPGTSCTWWRIVVVGAMSLVMLSCTGESSTGADAVAAARSSAPLVSSMESTNPTTSTTTSSTIISTTSSTTSPTTIPTSTTTTVPPPPGPLDLTQDIVGLGYSAQGRPIVAERYGTPGGRRMLVIGVIHGDEDAGIAIIDDLRRLPVPEGVELWVVESMNPDGVANQVRGNGNGVDLNRNFPHKWGPIGSPGDWQYAGSGPASEPETQAMVNFMEQLAPDIGIWYHQDLNVISPATGREGRIRARYAELTGLPMGGISGGTYTGIATTWEHHEFESADGVAFIVELGPTLSADEAATHANAVLTIAAES